MDTIRLVEAFNLLLAALFTVLYFYQLVYLVLGLIHRRETKKADGVRIHRYAAVISARRAGTTATLDQMNKYFGLMQMPIVTSQYWNMAHGACPEDVRQDLEGLQTMRTLGNNMAFFINCKNLGLKMGLKLPEEESRIRTNFIR